MVFFFLNLVLVVLILDFFAFNPFIEFFVFIILSFNPYLTCVVFTLFFILFLYDFWNFSLFFNFISQLKFMVYYFCFNFDFILLIISSFYSSFFFIFTIQSRIYRCPILFLFSLLSFFSCLFILVILLCFWPFVFKFILQCWFV